MAQDGGDFLRLFDRPFHALGGRRQDQLCPQQRQQGAPLHAHAIGHCQYELVALGRSHEGQCDPGIAACGFDKHSLARRDLARLLGGFNEGQADAVLHAGNRVLALQLDEQCAGAGVERPQLDQGRVADQVQDIRIRNHR